MTPVLIIPTCLASPLADETGTWDESKHLLSSRLTMCGSSWLVLTPKTSGIYSTEVPASLYFKNRFKTKQAMIYIQCTSGLILNGGNGGNCLRCPWSLPWCPFKSPNRNVQIPHRGALCQGKNRLAPSSTKYQAWYVHVINSWCEYQLGWLSLFLHWIVHIFYAYMHTSQKQMSMMYHLFSSICFPFLK